MKTIRGYFMEIGKVMPVLKEFKHHSMKGYEGLDV
jgi:hypothetical protein